MRFAPRISAHLLDAIVRLQDSAASFADVTRRVGEEAERLGYVRPSYERVRVLTHEARRIRRRRQPTTAQVLLDVTLRVRPPEAALEHLSGIGVPSLDP